MAALMIPGSKLTDIWGRKRCFIIGLIVYAAGGLLAALSPGLPLLITGGQHASRQPRRIRGRWADPIVSCCEPELITCYG